MLRHDLGHHLQTKHSVDHDQPFQSHLDRVEVESLNIGDRFDHRDGTGRFHKTQAADRKGSAVYVHYEGWNETFNIWCDFKTESHRFAAYRSISERPCHRFSGLAFVMGATMFILGISLSYQLLIGSSRLKWTTLSLEERAVQISAISVYIFGVLFAAQIIAQNIYQIITDSMWSQQLISWYTLTTTLQLSFRSVHLFLILRLHTVFKDSIFALRPAVYRMHLIAFVFIMATRFVVHPFLAMMYGSNSLSATALWTITAPIAGAAWVHLMYAFSHKLFQLVVTERQSVVERSASDKVDLSRQQQVILGTVRKHSLLGAVSILVAVFYALLYAAVSVRTRERFVDLYTDGDPMMQRFVVSFNIIILIALSILGVVLYLGFAANSAMYWKCCGCCDAQCQVICDRMATSKIRAAQTMSTKGPHATASSGSATV